MIETRVLCKYYGGIKAVDNLNLKVKRGELFGFLGPNGAGKTTTIRMLCGLIKPSSGSALIDGNDIVRYPSRTKALIGLIPDTPFLYPKLTGREFLSFVSRIYKVNDKESQLRKEGLLDFFELSGVADELIEGYSHGMRQRLCFCAAMIHEPRVLIVDEPMVGLDPKGRMLVRETFKGIVSKGNTVFMSTHSLDEAEMLCDRISVIHEGRLIALDTLDSLRSKTGMEKERLEKVFLSLTANQ